MHLLLLRRFGVGDSQHFHATIQFCAIDLQQVGRLAFVLLALPQRALDQLGFVFSGQLFQWNAGELLQRRSC